MDGTGDRGGDMLSRCRFPLASSDERDDAGSPADPDVDGPSPRLFQQTQCTCQDKVSKAEVYELKNYLNPSEAESVRERRMKEYEHFRRRHQTQNILIAPPHSPLSYPIHGVQVMPLHTILLPGLKVYEDLPKYVVTLEASLGTFGTLVNAASIEGSIVSGRGEKRLIISTADQNVLNYILNYTTYTSTVYSIDSMDIVKFTINQHLAQFPVSIKQPAMVRLYDPGADKKISSLVTITTKTFLRYDKLRELLKSIRQFYPDIKVIVADDNEVPEKIEDEHVEQYIMPYAKGWFAGRNLAVSQVTTKYFLWVDDDFLFTGDTKIEKLVDVLEGTDLDLVGGSVAGNHFSFKLLLEEGGVDGDCLHWRGGSYQGIEGFPNCVLTGGVVNFFLAHTDRVLSVGFDPKLQRVAHTEFFIDALGRLRVGSCNHVTVGHQQKSTPSDGQMAQQAKKYNAFRTNTQEQVNYKLGLHYFKNRLRCFTKH
ncbi:beta-1,4 N-acetylgalactosaminyltransferase 2 [Rhinophrynus dorsalis]